MEPEDKKISRALARKKPSTKAPTPTPSPRKRRKISPVARYVTLFVLLALAITVAVAHFGQQAWIQQNRQSQLDTFSRQYALTAAEAVSARLRHVQTQLETLANTPEAAATLADGKPEAIASLERRLSNFFSPVHSLRALPSGAVTTVTADEALRFAELDMIARAERRETVLPEAARQEEQWVVKFAVPVPAQQSAPVQGTLLLTLPIELVRPALKAGSEGYGEAQLLQSFNPRQSDQLLVTGQGDAGAAQTVEVPGSYWQLRFTPSSQLWQQTQVGIVIPLAGLGLFAALLITVAVYLGIWLGRKQQRQPSIKAPKSAPAATAEGQESPSAPTATDKEEPEDILDIEIAEEDESLLGLEELVDADEAPAPPTAEDNLRASVDVPEVIFRAYDIRGIAESEITPELSYQIGQALGSEALDNNQNALVVGRDVRTHSPVLAEQLVQGILSTGCRVVNLGVVPTPLMYFATETLPQTQSGVMVTASHNGAEYNGFKVVMTGKSRSAEDIQAVRTRILAQDFYSGRGTEEHLDIVPQYIDTIFSDVALAGDMHLVLDAGNGVAGLVAPQLFEELGCRVTCIHCEPDGQFPNHDPDPSIAANLQDLVAKVQAEQADLGLAFDGDGDRVTVVSPKGEIIWADRLLMLFAKDIVGRNPGADVVFDIKSTRQLNSAISSFGGRPIMWKTGHAPMRAKMLETGALLGGEFSGHIFIKDRWYGFDDGIYAAARLVEILSLRGETLDAALAEFPPQHITPEILIAVAEAQKFAIVRQLAEAGDFEDGKLTTMDGLRADFPKGWGLVRPSNTSAKLTLRFEAETQADLDAIKALFKRELGKVAPQLELDW